MLAPKLKIPSLKKLATKIEKVHNSAIRNPSLSCPIKRKKNRLKISKFKPEIGKQPAHKFSERMF